MAPDEHVQRIAFFYEVALLVAGEFDAELPNPKTSEDHTPAAEAIWTPSEAFPATLPRSISGAYWKVAALLLFGELVAEQEHGQHDVGLLEHLPWTLE